MTNGTPESLLRSGYFWAGLIGGAAILGMLAHPTRLPVWAGGIIGFCWYWVWYGLWHGRLRQARDEPGDGKNGEREDD